MVCFLLNNLLFTYSQEENTPPAAETITACESKDKCCNNEPETKNCCEKESCCANVPASSYHLSFSAIIGIEKKNEAIVPLPLPNHLNKMYFRTASELSEGHTASLIKPPSIS